MIHLIYVHDGREIKYTIPDEANLAELVGVLTSFIQASGYSYVEQLDVVTHSSPGSELIFRSDIEEEYKAMRRNKKEKK